MAGSSDDLFLLLLLLLLPILGGLIVYLYNRDKKRKAARNQQRLRMANSGTNGVPYQANRIVYPPPPDYHLPSSDLGPQLHRYTVVIFKGSLVQIFSLSLEQK